MTLRHIYRLLALAGLVLLPAGCRHRGGFDDTAFHWTDQLPAGARVHLLNGAGNITVRPASSPNVVVNGARAWRRSRPSDVRFVVSQIGKDYYVCAMWRSSGRCGPTGYRGRRVSTFLTMFSLFHHGNDATAELIAELPAGIGIDASTVNGTVDIHGVSGGVSAKSVNGSVRAFNVAGPLALSTTNGSIAFIADSLAPSDSVRISTINGTINATLPPAVQGYFDLSATNGSVRTDLPIQQSGRMAAGGRHLIGQVGISNRTVRMHTLNGDLSVTARSAAASQ